MTALVISRQRLHDFRWVTAWGGLPPALRFRVRTVHYVVTWGAA